jgi:hypothetical protein
VAFVSSALWTPQSSGIAGADLECQSEAQAAGLAGTFLAALGSTTATASSRFSLTGPVWVRPDGAPLGDTASQMFNGTLTPTTIAMTADGMPLPANSEYYWAGMPNQMLTDSCTDWTSTSPPMATTGNADSTVLAERFSAVTVQPCSSPVRLLCLQE